MLREVLLEWKEKELPQNIVKREIKFWMNNHIASIIGPRRAGKTYFMFQLIKELFEKKFSKENVVYVDFTDPRTIKVGISEFLKEVNSLFEGKIFLFLDEIQELENWSSFIRALHNLQKYKIIISGSSSKLLSKEISTELRGRCISFIIFPFNFREFLEIKKFKIEKEFSEAKTGEILRLLKDYVEFGGYPEILLADDKNKKLEIARTYFATIFFKDLIERFKIKNIALMDYFVRYCITNSSSYVSISKIENSLKSFGFKISKKTLANYLRYVEEALFVFPVKRFSLKYSERAQYPAKVYLVDNVYFGIEPRFSRDIGKKIENLVAIQLLKKKFEGKINEIFYFNSNDYEVDFVLKEGLRVKQLIQVTYASAKDEIEKRELKALLKASKELKCKDLLVITWDYENEIKIKDKKIKCLPLWKWFLKDKVTKY
ncbi:MAG: ATP-binding protein [Candidatus Aenigmatarchaeota archaeon]